MKFPFVLPLSVPFKAPVICAGLACLLLLLVCTQGSRAAAKPAQPDAPGSIAGMVKDSSDAPVAGIEVTAFQQNSYGIWQPLRVVQTNATGAYTVNFLGAGVYRLLFRDPQGALAQTYYPTATTIETATDIPVAGTDVSGIDVTLGIGGRITGTLTSAPGAITATNDVPPGGGGPFSIQAFQKVGLQWVSARAIYPSLTAPTYTLSGLPAGIYRICTSNNYPPYLYDPHQECYADTYAIADATDVPVVRNETTPKINFVWGDGADLAQISGTVTSLTSQPLANIRVSAFRMTSDSGGSWSQAAQTDRNGVYQLTKLRPGAYQVYFTDPQGAYIGQVYSPTLGLNFGTPITVTRRAKLAHIDAQLGIASHILGRVTVNGAAFPYASQINAYRKTGSTWQYFNTFAQTETKPPTGAYALDGLPAGEYKVVGATEFDGDVYQGFYGGTSLVNAAVITLTTAMTRTAVDFDLSSPFKGGIYSGVISGTVRFAGTPVPDLKVALYQTNCCLTLPEVPAPVVTPVPPTPTPTPFPFGVAQVRQGERQQIAQTTDTNKPLVYVTTDAKGHYTIGGLSDGAYYLGVSDPTATYATSYFNEQTALSRADAIYLHNGKIMLQNSLEISAVNVGLSLGGGISGTVHLKDGAPVANMPVGVYKYFQAGYWDLLTYESKTDAAGSYTVRGLPAGVYQVCFTDLTGVYPTECYGAPPDNLYPGNGAIITVQAGAMTRNIDHVIGPKLVFFLPLIQKQPPALPFNIATVAKCERQPAGNWFEGTTALNGQPQNGYKVVFSHKADGPWATNPVISGPHQGYPGWKNGYYSHIIRASGPIVGDWYVWIVDDAGKRISEIAHWRSTGPGEGCNQAEVDFDSR